MKNTGLTKRQLEIMKYFWESETSLLVSDIVGLSGLNIGTVQSSVKAMAAKNVIAEDKIIHSGKVLARTYKPIISKKDYLEQQYLNMSPVSKIMASILKKEKDASMIGNLEKMLADKKNELKGKEE